MLQYIFRPFQANYAAGGRWVSENGAPAEVTTDETAVRCVCEW
jgi:hypothetical protein